MRVGERRGRGGYVMVGGGWRWSCVDSRAMAVVPSSKCLAMSFPLLQRIS